MNTVPQNALRRLPRSFFALTFILISISTNALAQQATLDSLPRAAGWVVYDLENIFTYKQEEKLSQLITNFEKETTVEIAVLTLDTSAITTDNFDAFILAVANRWGVGKAGKDNGVVIGISKGLRYISVQNGYGIEKELTDAETKQIIDTRFLPKFKRGKYYKGTKNGLKALMNELKTTNAATP